MNNMGYNLDLFMLGQNFITLVVVYLVAQSISLRSPRSSHEWRNENLFSDHPEQSSAA
jgi:hypothetical protein